MSMNFLDRAWAGGLSAAVRSRVEHAGRRRAGVNCARRQPGDGKATIGRETQQQVTSEAVVKAMRRVSELPA